MIPVGILTAAATSSFVGLLDTYPGAAVAYSLRKLRNGYTGACVRVRRSSDNAESDINFTGAGYIDTAALLSFCGSSNGFVTIWYDQSVNANNATQTNAIDQNKIVNLGSLYTLGTKSSIYFENGFYNISNINILNDFSYFVTSQKTNGWNGILLGNSTNDLRYFTQWNDGFFYISKPNGTNTLRYSSIGGSNVYSILQGFSTTNVINSFWNNNNLSLTLNTTTASTIVNINIIGGLGFGGRTRFCPLQEIIIYTNSQLVNRTGIVSNTNTFYTIF